MVSLAEKNDYLKKYLSTDEKDKKKKKRKSKKSHGSGLLIEEDTAFAMVAPGASSSLGNFANESGSDDDPEVEILKSTKKVGGFIASSFQTIESQVTVKEEPVDPEEKEIKQELQDSGDESRVSPKRRKRNDSSDASPPRRRQRKDSPDASPPRRRQRNDSRDASPPRRQQRRDSPDHRRKRSKSLDASPPRRRQRNDSRDASPPRRRQRNDDPAHHHKRSMSPSTSSSRHKKIKKESDSSPPRRRQRNDTPEASPSRRHQRNRDPSPEQNQLRRKRLTKEQEARNSREAKKQAELDKKYAVVSRGVAQAEECQQKIKEMEQTVQESFSRHADDESMNKLMKGQLLGEDDPMNEYMAKKNMKIRMKSESVYPTYTGHFPPNRYNIGPGYRWDGVDRSNGFESKMALRANRQVAEQGAAYRMMAELAE